MSWYGKNNYLNSADRLNNATIIHTVLTSLGWSVNAICAILGNMDKESTINPNIYEGLVADNSRGYGLVQWTPATKLIDWCNSVGKDYTDGYAQLDRIEWERKNSQQWGRNGYADDYGFPNNPPITFQEFAVSNLDVNTLTNYFVLYYERPAQQYYESSLQGRKDVANYYYELFGSTVEEYKIRIQPKIICAEEGSDIQFNASVTVPDGVSNEVEWEVFIGDGVESLGNGKFYVNSILTNVVIKCTLKADTSIYDVASISPIMLKPRNKMPIWLYLKKL